MDSITALPIRGATTPPKILFVVATPHASGHYRIAGPAMAARVAGLATTKVEHVLPEDSILKTLNPDVIVVQHQFTDPQLAALKRFKTTLPKVTLVYEIDDMLWDIPDTNPHKKLFPVDIKSRLTKGMGLCDRVVVSTAELARVVERDLKVKASKIHVVQNALPRAFVTNALAARRALPTPRAGGARPRVGWAGGDSHAADLAILNDAMIALGDEVQWVFLGSLPGGAPDDAEFHPAVPMGQYPAKLGSLDLDLALAPLVHNPFNHCKSDLRAMEYAAAGFAVLASECPSYCETPSCLLDDTGWEDEIRDRLFTPAGLSRCDRLADMGHAWVKETRILEDNVDDWMRAWVPASKIYTPRPLNEDTSVSFVSVGNDDIEEVENFPSIAKAHAARPTSHIILSQPGTHGILSCLGDMRGHLQGNASASAISNRGDFPTPGQFTPLPGRSGVLFQNAAYEANGHTSVPVPYPGGPCVILSNRALLTIGLPNVDGYPSLSVALMDWGARAIEVGMSHVALPGCAVLVDETDEYKDNTETLRHLFSWYPALPESMQKARDNPSVRDYRERTDLMFWKSRIDAPEVRTYTEWFDTHYYIPEYAAAWMKEEEDSWGDSHPRIRVVPSTHLRSWPLLTEEDGNWVIFKHPDDTLEPHALHMFGQRARDPDVDMIYSDHDHLGENGVRTSPHFKPDFDYDLFLAGDYTGMCAFRISALQNLMGQRPLDTDAPLYDLKLRMLRLPGRVAHAPFILWTEGDRPHEDTHAVLMRHLSDTKQTAAVTPLPSIPGFSQVRHLLQGEAPTVSIIIYVRDNAKALNHCLGSLMHLTAYTAFQVIVVNAGSNSEVSKVLKATQGNEAFIIDTAWKGCDKWVALPQVVVACKTDFVCFLDPETQVIEASWLNDLVAAACRPGVGAVGGRLLTMDGRVHTAGIMFNPNQAPDEIVQYAFRGEPYTAPGPHGRALLTQTWSAVSEDCLCVRRDLLSSEGYTSGIDLCMQLGKEGLRNLCVPQSILIHHGDFTTLSRSAQETLADENQDYETPEWNHNVAWGPDLSLASPRPMSFPWTRERETVLLIGGSVEDAQALYRDGKMCFRAQIEGSVLHFVAPNMTNVEPVALRDSTQRMSEILSKIGASGVVLRSLGRGSMDALGFLGNLKKLGWPMSYIPGNFEPVCPRLNCRNDEGPCQEQWKNGTETCQQCVDTFGSIAGYVSVAAYRLSWARFLDILYPQVTTEPTTEAETADAAA